MFRTATVSALALCAFILVGNAHATLHLSDRASAEACARALQEKSGEHVYEVVKILSHPGFGSYSIWLNSESDSFAGFCATSRGEVTTSYARDAHWEKGELYRPEASELAAR